MDCRKKTNWQYRKPKHGKSIQFWSLIIKLKLYSKMSFIKSCLSKYKKSFDRISGDVTNTSPPASSVAVMSCWTSGWRPLSGANQSICGARPVSRASVRMRRPSAKNRPSRRRAFLSRKALTRLTSGLEYPEISKPEL